MKSRVIDGFLLKERQSQGMLIVSLTRHGVMDLFMDNIFQFQGSLSACKMISGVRWRFPLNISQLIFLRQVYINILNCTGGTILPSIMV